MKPLQWQPYMALGIAEIDAAHRTFVTGLAALHDCPDHQLGAGIATLRRTLARGFVR